MDRRMRYEVQVVLLPIQRHHASIGSTGEQNGKDVIELDFLKWRLDCVVCREKPSSKSEKKIEGSVEEETEEWDVVLGRMLCGCDTFSVVL